MKLRLAKWLILAVSVSVVSISVAVPDVQAAQSKKVSKKKKVSKYKYKKSRKAKRVRVSKSRSKKYKRSRAKKTSRRYSSKRYKSRRVYRTCDQNSPHVLRAKARPYQHIINQASRQYGVDANLIKAVITAETCFRPTATSHKGAGGLMQLMPATAKRFGATQRYNEYQNIHAGTRYLRWLLNRYNGSVRHAVAAYNSGEGRVDRYGIHVPFKETQQYLKRVMNAFSKLSKTPAGVRVQHASYHRARQQQHQKRKRQQYQYNVRRAGMVLGGTASGYVQRPQKASAAPRGRVINGSGQTLSCKMIPRRLYRQTQPKNTGYIRAFYYKVTPQDVNIDVVARKTGRPVQDLLTFNKLPSRSLKVGQTLKVAQCHF